jgi:hypothetical protein
MGRLLPSLAHPAQTTGATHVAAFEKDLHVYLHDGTPAIDSKMPPAATLESTSVPTTAEKPKAKAGTSGCPIATCTSGKSDRANMKPITTA